MNKRLLFIGVAAIILIIVLMISFCGRDSAPQVPAAIQLLLGVSA